MKVGNTEIEFHIDYVNKKFHLVDLDNTGMHKLTNYIDPTYQKKLIEQESLLSDLIDFEWICYSNDGYIASYLNYNFKILSPKVPYLFKPYLDYMQKTKKGNM